MAKPQGNFPLGKSEKIDVALMRPTVNLKEAENQGEQAEAAARTTAPPVKFAKHGAFPGGNPAHSVMDLFGKD
jgi:hypothetical protein